MHQKYKFGDGETLTWNYVASKTCQYYQVSLEIEPYLISKGGKYMIMVDAIWNPFAISNAPY